MEPGFSSVEGLHFKVFGSDRAVLETLLTRAEVFYERLMHDTGLYSFRPQEPYRIIVYDSHDHYRQATRQPSWSGGVAVGNTIGLYAHPNWEPVLAHEMTHVIFYEFMGSEASRWRWINEGLAMMQERQTLDTANQDHLKNYWRSVLRQQAMPMNQVTAFTPYTENERDVNLWYNQVESVIEFLIERGGRLNFAQFLERLRSTKDLDTSLSYAFSSKFPNLETLEKTWKAELR